MPTPLNNETGQFIYSLYGSGHALMFRGDEKFLDRCFNLISNFHYLPKQIIEFDTQTHYVILDEGQINEMVLRACKAEIYLDESKKTICQGLSDEDYEKYLNETSVNEEKVLALAQQSVQSWWSKVVRENLLTQQYSLSVPTYQLGTINEVYYPE